MQKIKPEVARLDNKPSALSPKETIFGIPLIYGRISSSPEEVKVLNIEYIDDIPYDWHQAVS